MSGQPDKYESDLSKGKCKTKRRLYHDINNNLIQLIESIFF
jgi:hypothetical protein